MLSCNSTKCHCPACNAKREEIAKIADERIALEREACNRTGDRFGHHALRNRHVPYHTEDNAAKLATVRELCRRVCLHSEFGKHAGRHVLEAYGATTCSQLSVDHYDAVIRTYRMMLEGAARGYCVSDAERAARRDRVTMPDPVEDRYIEHLAPRYYRSRQSYYDSTENKVFKWRWRPGVRWMKVTAKGMAFGPRYRKVIFNPTGYVAYEMHDKIGKPSEKYTEAGILRANGEIVGRDAKLSISAIEHTETKTVGAISTTTTDRVEFLPYGDVFGRQYQFTRDADGNVKWLSSFWKDIDGPRYGGKLEDNLKQSMNWAGANTGRWEAVSMEITDLDPENLRAAFIGGGAKTGPDAEDDPINFGGTMISALKLSILFWRKAHHSSWAYPARPGLGHGAVREALQSLCRDKLIAFGSEDNEYTLTPRAEVLLEAIQNLPLPVQPEPFWTMPKA